MGADALLLAGQERNGQSTAPTALVIGLGGGCLPIYLRHVLGFSTQVAELDPCVADLAAALFGFAPDEQLQVSGEGGGSVLQQSASRKLVAHRPCGCHGQISALSGQRCLHGRPAVYTFCWHASAYARLCFMQSEVRGGLEAIAQITAGPADELLDCCTAHAGPWRIL